MLDDFVLDEGVSYPYSYTGVEIFELVVGFGVELELFTGVSYSY